MLGDSSQREREGRLTESCWDKAYRVDLGILSRGTSPYAAIDRTHSLRRRRRLSHVIRGLIRNVGWD